MKNFWNDIRFATRSLARTPGFTLTAILTLTIAIGASTAAFSVLNGVVLRPLPFENPDELLWISRTMEEPRLSGAALVLSTFVKFEEQAGTVDLAASYDSRANLVGEGPPEMIEFTHVTANYFRVLGIEPILGRTITSAELLEDGTMPALITYGEWRSRWGGAPDVLGRSFRVEGELPMTIIGVLPEGFRSERDTPPTPVWTIPSESHYTSRSGVYWTVGRAHAGEDIDSVRAELGIISDGLARAEPEIEGGGRGIRVEPLTDFAVSQSNRRTVSIFGAAVGSVFLIGLLNLLNLQLSRMSGHTRELSLRAALGAPRWALVRRMIAESVLLAGTATLLATGLLYALRDLAIASVPPVLVRMDNIVMDGAAFAFAVGAAVIAVGVVGLIPALRASRPDVNEALKNETRASTGGIRQRRLRDVLTLTETALAVVLLVAAGLLIHSFHNLTSQDLGFDPTDVLTARVSLPSRYADQSAAMEAFFRDMLAGIEALPGVDAASVSNALPIEGGSSTGVRTDDEVWTAAMIQDVSARYFDVLGIPVLLGRGITEDDIRSRALVAVVSESAADALWPGERPLGKRIKGFGDDDPPWRTVVGVTTDIAANMSQGPRPVVYSPYTAGLLGESTWRGHSMIFGIRTVSGGVSAPVERLIVDAEPDSVVTVDTMDGIIGNRVARQRFQTMLLTTFAVLAIALAMLGVFSVVAFAMSQRTREIGLRIALGSTPEGVVRQAVRRGVWPPALGLASGLGVSAYVMRFLERYLKEVEPIDAWAYLAAAVVGSLLILLASWLPARRAAAVDPMDALRYQ